MKSFNFENKLIREGQKIEVDVQNVSYEHFSLRNPFVRTNLKFPNDCGLLVESIKNLEGRFSENMNA